MRPAALATPRRRLVASDLVVSLAPVTDFAALEPVWRELEGRADGSFFQSWTWTGCLAGERFAAPLLLRAEERGRVAALALFNRRGRTLYLGESGDVAQDSPYIEFNGVLAERGREDELTAACLGALRGWPGTSGPLAFCHALFGPGRVVLSGLDARQARAAARSGHAWCRRSSVAPHAVLPETADHYLAARSANTRSQLRRSERQFATLGPVTVARAATIETGLAFLAGLEALHQRAWTARGEPGAFARPFFGRFHRELVARGLPRGEIELTKLAAGARVIGYLYNFRYRDRVLAYQSGFEVTAGEPRGKPGMTCHFEAIRAAIGAGATRYDFLAGDSRYKRSLSDAAETLYWLELGARFSPRSLIGRLRDGPVSPDPDDAAQAKGSGANGGMEAAGPKRPNGNGPGGPGGRIVL